MSFNQKKREGRGRGSAGISGGDKTYKRDTIAAIIVMAVIFISPVAIMATTNYGTHADGTGYEATEDDYADLAPATASEAEEAESEDTTETDAVTDDEEASETETDIETEQVSETDADTETEETTEAEIDAASEE